MVTVLKYSYGTTLKFFKIMFIKLLVLHIKICLVPNNAKAENLMVNSQEHNKKNID